MMTAAAWAVARVREANNWKVFTPVPWRVVSTHGILETVTVIVTIVCHLIIMGGSLSREERIQVWRVLGYGSRRTNLRQ